MYATAHHIGGREQRADGFGDNRSGGTGFAETAAVLDWIHEAAHSVAVDWSGRRCVTISVGNISLDGPIRSGTAVSTDARVIYTRDDTMDVLVTVCVAGTQIAQCSIVLGAIDDMGRPVDVEPWHPDTMLEMQRCKQARSRERVRIRIEELIAAAAEPGAGTAPVHVLHRAVSPGERVRGAHVLHWVDQACHAVGAAWAGGGLCTSYIAGVQFARPVFAGPAAHITGRLIHTGSRTLHIGVRIADSAEPRTAPIASAVVVLEAPDRQGRPQPVRQWLPGCDDERRLRDHARRLVEMRQFVEPFSAWSTGMPA